MPSDLMRRAFFEKINSALHRARNASEIEHPGLRGRAREIFLQDMLKPILPPYVEFGGGKLVDSEGNQSAETDAVIYSSHTLPPLLFEMGFGLYPVEAAIYAIEVKSKLTATELSSTIKKFSRLQDLVYLPSATNERFEPAGPSSAPVIPCLFAFDTDLSDSGKDELERYRELDPNSEVKPAVPVFCVAGRGYWWFKPNEPAEKWIKHLPTENNEEILEFIGGVANTIPEQIIRKGRPAFGNYLIQPRGFEKH